MLPALEPQIAPNTTLVTSGGLGTWSSVLAAGIGATLSTLTLYYQYDRERDAAKQAAHQRARDAEAAAKALAAQQAAYAAAAQTAAVQTATSGAQGASTSPVALMTAQALGSPMVLLGGVAVAAVLAFALMRGRR